ncbi:MAG TPA: phosphoglycerate mutase family protein [Acidimicrobiales bacterium]|nr:phosphoglycerate mutase family protein [Acidimicrobiales bacterium]
MTAQLLLVRHGSAGSRSRWAGPDHLRPLDAKGHRQAEALAAAWTGAQAPPISKVLSSPYLRCVQTVEPLAGRVGLSVKTEPALAEGHGAAAVALARDLLARKGAGSSPAGRMTVLCTHGDIIPAILAEVAADGVDVGSDPRWSKGSAWLLEGASGLFTAAHYRPPAPPT